uniref:Ionotropic receptor 21a n=1 Tax=Streltzoviella insularis TaxID=1206366 RepID=A0A7D5YVP3_9NEOP|nr:ionotropic receptor 21a [Streltzoviella insularis]
MELLLNILILKFLFYAYGQEIEYYPSQNVLDNSVVKIGSNSKQQLINTEYNELFSKNAHDKIQWRYFNENESDKIKNISKRATDPVFYGHPKTTEELWNEHFLNQSSAFDQMPSLIKLIHNITLTYLSDCIPVILYDKQVKSQESYLFEDLFKHFPITYVHGYINDDDTLKEPKLLFSDQNCLHFIVFLTDVKTCTKVLGKQSQSKVVVVARSSQWAVQEYLASPLSRVFVNLLVIGQSFKDDDDDSLEAAYILYTHKLYTDGLGASRPVVLNSWSHGKYSREVNLFPKKMRKGYAGHRFLVAAANQPPFVFRRIKRDEESGNPKVVWDGIEVRLLQLLADRNNFSIEIVEPRELNLGPGDAVAKEIVTERADIGIAGIYLTEDRIREMDVTFAHSQDCAAFITLMSIALPRYRAILGPFHWHVWLALSFTYIFAIFPLAFSDKLTLRHLIHNGGEVENMFWYVFGTFTNCFTFVGKNSWSKTTKITTRLLIGWYWVFTIIITSCYTGSIIAFVTLPVYPETVDSVRQLLSGFYRIGTLDRGGWERWFLNSSDKYTNKLFKKIELVPSVEAGIRNTTKAFFWPYAFLGSRAELEYIVQSNFSMTKSKRGLLHISNECFVPFGVSFAFPNNSLYTAKFSNDVRRMLQSGIIQKIVDEVRWEMQRSSTGKLLSAGIGSLNTLPIEEKGLTLEDTQGMFLLLGAGFLIAASALISEWIGGCSRLCRLSKNKNPPTSINSGDHLIPTPKTDTQSTINIISDGTDSRLHFDTRPQSADSRDTLDGQIINVTEENITVHDNFKVDGWDSRRSSSIDLDREVKEIFEKDQKRRRIFSDGMIELSGNKRHPTASKGAFGDTVGN